MQFLDYVVKEEGRLVVLGDLLELYRFRLANILEQWGCLLDQLHALTPIYVAGNHDTAVLGIDPAHLPHSVFKHVHAPFIEWIGDKRLCFMHGHELDPFIPNSQTGRGIIQTVLSGLFTYCSHFDFCCNEVVLGYFLELGEQLLRLWQGLKRDVGCIIDNHTKRLSDEPFEDSRRSIRIRRMMARIYHHRAQEKYDIAIVGHTHCAGAFGQWYYNSGCWTKQASNFLKIWPDGHIEVCNWGKHGNE